MARPRKGARENDLLLTQKLCHLIKSQSGMSDREIEELFGFGALSPTSKDNRARTGRSFNRYLNGERAMSRDLLQSIAKRAVKMPWWIYASSELGKTNGLFGNFGELKPLLGLHHRGTPVERFSATYKKAFAGRKEFERTRSQLKKSIAEMQHSLEAVSAISSLWIGYSEEGYEDDEKTRLFNDDLSELNYSMNLLSSWLDRYEARIDPTLAID